MVYIDQPALSVPSKNPYLFTPDQYNREKDFLLLSKHYLWDDSNGTIYQAHQITHKQVHQNNVVGQDNSHKFLADNHQKPQRFNGTKSPAGIKITDKQMVGRDISEPFRQMFLQYAFSTSI